MSNVAQCLQVIGGCAAWRLGMFLRRRSDSGYVRDLPKDKNQ